MGCVFQFNIGILILNYAYVALLNTQKIFFFLSIMTILFYLNKMVSYKKYLYGKKEKEVHIFLKKLISQDFDKLVYMPFSRIFF